MLTVRLRTDSAANTSEPSVPRGRTIRRVAYEETEHYQVTRTFLMNPQRYFAHLFGPEDGDE